MNCSSEILKASETFKNPYFLCFPVVEMALLQVGEEEKKIENVRVCPECGSEDSIYENEELYCKKCGLVLD